MSSLSNEKENKVFKVVTIFGDIFALNVFFVLFSLPIITIGASLTAMYTMMLRMADHKEGTLWGGFVKAFKSNFKQATKAWLLVLLALVIIAAEILFIIQFGGPITVVYSVVVVIEVIALCLVLAFLFPVISRYENTLWNSVKNAFLLSVSNLWQAIKIILAWVMPVFLSFYDISVFYSTWYLWLLLIFGLITYGSSFSIRKVFKRIEAAQEAREKEEEEQRAKEKKIQELRADHKKYHRSHRDLMKQLAEDNKAVEEE